MLLDDGQVAHPPLVPLDELIRHLGCASVDRPLARQVGRLTELQQPVLQIRPDGRQDRVAISLGGNDLTVGLIDGVLESEPAGVYNGEELDLLRLLGDVAIIEPAFDKEALGQQQRQLTFEVVERVVQALQVCPSMGDLIQRVTHEPPHLLLVVAQRVRDLLRLGDPYGAVRPRHKVLCAQQC